MRLAADGLKRMMYEHSSITTDEEHIVMRHITDEVSKVMVPLDGLSQRSFPPFVETAKADPTLVRSFIAVFTNIYICL